MLEGSSPRDLRDELDCSRVTQEAHVMADDGEVGTSGNAQRARADDVGVAELGDQTNTQRMPEETRHPSDSLGFRRCQHDERWIRLAAIRP